MSTESEFKYQDIVDKCIAFHNQQDIEIVHDTKYIQSFWDIYDIDQRIEQVTAMHMMKRMQFYERYYEFNDYFMIIHRQMIQKSNPDMLLTFLHNVAKVEIFKVVSYDDMIQHAQTKKNNPQMREYSEFVIDICQRAIDTCDNVFDTIKQTLQMYKNVCPERVHEIIVNIDYRQLYTSVQWTINNEQLEL